jgi:hypothetical protein
MLIFYAGYGFIPIALCVLSGLVDMILGFDTNNHSVMGISTLAAGILTGVAITVLKVRDSRSEQRAFKLVSTRHTLLFIPVIFWCPILIAIGVHDLIGK